MQQNSETTLLEVTGLRVRYGVVEAVRGIDFTLLPGTSTAIVGSNGAGKSTTLLSLVDCLPSNAKRSGEIHVCGNSLSQGSAHDANGLGVTLVPESGKVFTLMTVEENLSIAGRTIRQPTVTKNDVYGWFPRLAERRKTLAGNLSGGEQQMLAIGMALVGSPRLLILDEPTLGLATPAIEAMCEMLKTLRRDLSLTLLIAEADVRWLSHVSDAAIVIDRGKVISRYDSIVGQLDIIQRILTGDAVGQVA